MRQDASKSSKDRPRKRLYGVVDRRQLAKQDPHDNVKFKVEKLPMP